MANDMKIMVAVIALAMCISTAMATLPRGKKIMVGGDKGWRYGVDYAKWASTLGPICVGDVLVFKYQPSPFPHNVLVLKNMNSYKSCNFTSSAKVGGPTDGATKDGVQFVLRKQRRYHFACTIGDGIHCEMGQMRFRVTVTC